MKQPRAQHHSGARHEPALEPRHADPYAIGRKPEQDSVCPDCGVVFHVGRWRWGSPPADAVAERCPACHRIQDDYPGGNLLLRGPFLVSHRAEILALVRAREAHEKEEHPLERVMTLEEHPESIVITTTGMHLARVVAHALQAAYNGHLNTRYLPDESRVRMVWTR